MSLASQGSQFVFSLPPDFLPVEIVETYKPILEKNMTYYDSVIDYLNSSIKSVNFPGLSVDLPNQMTYGGKKVERPSSKNVQDILSRELSITWYSKDSHLNYWLMVDIFIKHYLNVDTMYIPPMKLTVLDAHRDAIYEINFSQILGVSMSDLEFDYSQQLYSNKEFTVVFKFNYLEIDFLLNKSKVLELSKVSRIIQKIGNAN
jgi:hypothetical protein